MNAKQIQEIAAAAAIAAVKAMMDEPMGRAPKAKAKPKRKVDRRTANERQADKHMRRIQWHEARLAGLGSKATPGQVRWNKAEIDRLTDEVVRLRGHAVEHGETLPDDVKAAQTAYAAKSGRDLPPTREAIMAARKGDRVHVADATATCSGGGWFRFEDGVAIRRADLADLVD